MLAGSWPSATRDALKKVGGTPGVTCSHWTTNRLVRVPQSDKAGVCCVYNMKYYWSHKLYFMFSKNVSNSTSCSTWFLTFNWGHCTVLRFVRLSQSAKLDVGDTQLIISGLVIDLIWFCVDMHLIRISFCLLEECFNQCCLLNWTLLYLICFCWYSA